MFNRHHITTFDCNKILCNKWGYNDIKSKSILYDFLRVSFNAVFVIRFTCFRKVTIFKKYSFFSGIMPGRKSDDQPLHNTWLLTRRP